MEATSEPGGQIKVRGTRVCTPDESGTQDQWMSSSSNPDKSRHDSVGMYEMRLVRITTASLCRPQPEEFRHVFRDVPLFSSAGEHRR